MKCERYSGCEGLYKFRSSGSTGQPVDVYLDENELLSMELSYIRMFRNMGMNSHDRLLYIAVPRSFPMLMRKTPSVTGARRYVRQLAISAHKTNRKVDAGIGTKG